MCEVEASLKVSGHAIMVDKFPAIFLGVAMHPNLVGGEALCDLVTNSFGRLVENTVWITVYRDFLSTSVTRAH